MSNKRITLTLRCEVIKPLNMTWDDLGGILRALQAPVHRVLNNTITSLELESARKTEVHPQTLSYRLVGQHWDAEREASKIRSQDPKNKYAELDAAIAEVEPGSSLQLGTAGLAYTKWKNWAKPRQKGQGSDKWTGKSTLPTFKRGAPLTIASSSDAVRFSVEDGQYILSVRLLGGRGGSVGLVVKPYGGSGFADAKRIIKGLADANPLEDKIQKLKKELKVTNKELEADKYKILKERIVDLEDQIDVSIGDCKLVYDDGKWQAMLSWTRIVPLVTKGHTMAIHRGVRCFLACAIDQGDKRDSVLAMDFESGGDILDHKAAYTARRKSLGRHGGFELGDGARGRGVARREERITRLQDAEAAWIRTRCQQIAARTIKLALQRGVSEILIEDWGNPARDGAPELGEHIEYMVRSFPMAQLKESIIWAANKCGISIKEVSTKYNSRKCPKCNTLNESTRADVFKCSNCMLQRNVDAIAVWNMLIDSAPGRGGVSGEKLVKDSNRANQRAVEGMMR